MMPSRRAFLTVCAVAAMTGSAHTAPITRKRFHALGTEAQITLVGRPERAESALIECHAEIAAIESAFSLYDPNSMLSRLNRDGKIESDSRFDTLMRYALAIAEQTGGAFDPTVQPLWKAFANGGDQHQARALIDWRAIRQLPGTVSFSQPAMAVTFNGIAQGFAADRVAAILARHGFRDTLVDLGEFAVSGSKSGDTWRLGIRNPLDGKILIAIEPAAAIATSEPHGTLIAGHSHIVDPLARQGRRWKSVTVEASEAWRADALSTAIAASPMQQAEGFLANAGALRSWLITDAGELREWSNTRRRAFDPNTA